jgi:hypothetical protein
LKNNVNSWFGSYVDAGPTGLPFYGYALNGIATAYTTFNGTTGRFEYHHTTDATPDFFISNTQAAFPIQTFLGVGTSTPTTGSATGFTLKNNVNTYYGMYVDAGATGEPFYGYALNGVAKAWMELNGINSNWELNYFGSRIDVTSAGNVGIGTTSPSAKLSVNGTADKPGGGSWAVFSDARLKSDITPYEDGLSSLMKINPVLYHYNELSGCDTKPEYIGVVAQDLQKVAPYMVGTFTKDDVEYLKVDNSAMTYMLINAVKEQQQMIEQLREEIEMLKKK